MIVAQADWTAVGMLLALCVLVGIAAVYVAATFWLFPARTDPEVVVFATNDELDESTICLVVRNIGTGVASDIRFRWSATPVRADGLHPDALPPPQPYTGPLVRGIRELGPGSGRVFVWGQHAGVSRALDSSGGELRVLCEYDSRRPRLLGGTRRHRREYTLDVRSFEETRDAPLRRIHRELEEIGRSLKKMVEKAW